MIHCITCVSFCSCVIIFVQFKSILISNVYNVCISSWMKSQSNLPFKHSIPFSIATRHSYKAIRYISLGPFWHSWHNQASDLWPDEELFLGQRSQEVSQGQCSSWLICSSLSCCFQWHCCQRMPSFQHIVVLIAFHKWYSFSKCLIKNLKKRESYGTTILWRGSKWEILGL